MYAENSRSTAKYNYQFLQSSATFAALPLSLHTTRPFAFGTCGQLTEFSKQEILAPSTHLAPVSLLLADLGICQHGLEASKQAVGWHTPWEKINSFCEHWVTTQTLVSFQSTKYFELGSPVTEGSTPAWSFLQQLIQACWKVEQGGIHGRVPSQRASAEVFCQYKLNMGEAQTRQLWKVVLPCGFPTRTFPLLHRSHDVYSVASKSE